MCVWRFQQGCKLGTKHSTIHVQGTYSTKVLRCRKLRQCEVAAEGENHEPSGSFKNRQQFGFGLTGLVWTNGILKTV